MPPLEFHFIPLHEALLPRLIDDWGGTDAALLLPTETSRFAAQRLLQKQGPFSGCNALTWASFKDQLLLCDQPLLKEEKRTLAFYASLDEESRAFFKIRHYFQSIELAHRFFALFEECAEAEREIPDPQTFIAAGIDWLPWQEKTLEVLVHIRARYQQWITQHGFADRIFIRNANHLDFSSCAHHAALILVDHLRCSAFERRLLQALCDHDHRVLLYYHLPEHLLDKALLQVRPCTAGDFPRNPDQQISLWTCPNSFSLYHQLLKILDHEPVHHVVDADAQPHALQHFLSPAHFHLPGTIPMSETSIHACFDTLLKLLDALLYDPDCGRTLLPLLVLLEAFLQPDFARALSATATDAKDSITHEQLIILLHKLQKQDYCYVDLQRTFFSAPFPERRSLQRALDPLLDLVANMLRIQNIAQLAEWVDAPGGIPIRRIIRSDELACSDLLEVFYQSLADFTAIAELGLIDDCASLFSGDARFANPRGILRLFLEYIKSRRIHINLERVEGERVDLLSLPDTQGLAYPALALLNLTESNLPHRPPEPFLFNDQQRQMLGLTTLEETKSLQKYRFLRPALATPQLHLLTIRNIEKDIEPSSFLEELLLALPADAVQGDKISDVDYQSYAHGFFRVDTGAALPRAIREQERFFELPFEAGDFADGAWPLSYYACKQLMQDTFGYFVDQFVRLPEWPETWELTWSKLFLGKVAQHLFDGYWGYFLIDQASYGDFAQIGARHGRRAVERLFAPESDYYFCMPKNHELVYFREITLPVIEQSLQTFFRELSGRARMQPREARVYPEQKYAGAAEQQAKRYLSRQESGLEVDVLLQGRADLRLEAISSLHAFIVDYKTGSRADPLQLLFYELYYYLIQEPQRSEWVNSSFYHILEQRFEPLKLTLGRRTVSKADYLQAFRAELQSALLAISRDGYTPGRRRNWQETHLDDIIRRDQYQPSQPG